MKTILNTVIAISTILLAGCGTDSSTGFSSLTVQVELMFGDEPLLLNESDYTTNGGNLIIEDFKNYLSNFKLESTNGVIYEEADSYHLVEASQSSNLFEIVLKHVPEGIYSKIMLSIGVDSLANVSLSEAGDLDPTNQMAWNWDIGYKFVLLEGRLFNSDSQIQGLIYHIGFNENYRELVFAPSTPFVISDIDSENNIKLTIDVEQLFMNPNSIDISEKNEIRFNKEDAEIIAENYSEGYIFLTE